MAPFTPKSTQKFRSALHFKKSPVISHPSFPIAISIIVCFKNPKLNHNNHYNRVFCNTFDYNTVYVSDYLMYTVTAMCDIVRATKIYRHVEYLKLSFETIFF